MMIIDLPSDRGFVHFARLTKSLPELPEFVKEASTEGCVTPADLPASSFADSINKKFPIHTKASAFLSYLYFQDQKDKFTKEAASRVLSQFDRAADIWGIKTEMQQALQQPAQEKQAWQTEDYALHVANEHFFPLDTPTSTVKSANELIECRSNFTYEMRKEAATNIMKAAVAHGFGTVDLPEELHCMAGFGLCDKGAAVKEINRRVAYAVGSHSPLSKTMAKLASDVQNAETLDPETMAKVAEVVDTVDRELQITAMYGGSFQYPEDVFFGHFTEKTAARIKKTNIAMITGKVYTLDQLSKAADAMRVFGNDFYDDVVRGDGSVDLQQVADVLPTMPRDEAALFDRAMCSVKEAQGPTEGKSVPQLQQRMRTLKDEVATTKGINPVKPSSTYGYKGTPTSAKAVMGRKPAPAAAPAAAPATAAVGS